MNAKRVVRSLVVPLLVAVLLWAGEPWKDKPYTEWTQQEAQEILLRSPWARQLWIQSSGTEPFHDHGGPGRPPIEFPVPDMFVVQWASALTIRQATFRLAQLQGREEQQEAMQVLSSSPAEHKVRVSGPFMRILRGVSEADVQQSAYLKLKHSKEKVAASSAHFVKVNSQPIGVEFAFPRQVDGKPSIPLDEQKLTFFCDLGKVRIGEDFNLRKMVRDGKPDL